MNLPPAPAKVTFKWSAVYANPVPKAGRSESLRTARTVWPSSPLAAGRDENVSRSKDCLRDLIRSAATFSAEEEKAGKDLRLF